MVEINQTVETPPLQVTLFCRTQQLPLAVLEGRGLKVIASDNDYADVDWASELSSSLSADALFSMCERQVLKEVLLPNIGGALGIVLSNWNLILERDRSDIEALLNVFFDETTPIFKLPQTDEEELTTMLKRLPDRLDELRELRRKRARKFELMRELESVDAQFAALETDDTQLDETIAFLTEKSTRLPEQKERTRRQVRMHFLEPMRMNAAKGMMDFNLQLLDKVHEELAQSNDPDETRRLLPEYICTMWENRSEQVLEQLNIEAQQMASDFCRFLGDDFEEFLEANTYDHLNGGLSDFYESSAWERCFRANPALFNMEGFVEPSLLKRYGPIALGAALALTAHPIVGAAVAVFGARSFKRKLFADNREALLKAVDQMCYDVYNAANLWLDERIEGLAKQVFDCIEDFYRTMIEDTLASLNDMKQNKQSGIERLTELTTLKARLEVELKTVGK